MAAVSHNAGQMDLNSLFNDINYNLKENIINDWDKEDIINDWNVHSYHTVEAIRVWIYDIGDEMPRFLSSVESLGSDCKIILTNFDKLKEKAFEKLPDVKTPEYNEHYFNVNISLIGFEIERFFASHEHLYYYNWEKLQEYWKSLCWTKEGKINSLKTAENIINNTKITFDDKYLIACNNCMEDKIELMLKEFSEMALRNLLEYCSTSKQANGNKEYNPYLLALFWTYYFQENLHQFSSTIDSPPDIYIYMVSWAITHSKDVAVQHLWEKFGTRERNSILNGFADSCLTRKPSFKPPFLYRSNILLYLIKRNPAIRFEKMHNDYCKCVLLNVERISRQKFVSKPDFVLELIKNRDAWDCILLLAFAWSNNILNLTEYSNIFENLSPTVKNEVTNDLPYFFKNIIHEILVDTEINNFPTVKLILGIVPDEVKRDVMYERDGLYTCDQLIKNKKLDVLNLLLNEVFKDETNLSKFKKRIFEKNRNF